MSRTGVQRRGESEDEIPPVPQRRVAQVPSRDIPAVPEEDLPEVAQDDVPEAVEQDPPDPEGVGGRRGRRVAAEGADSQ